MILSGPARYAYTHCIASRHTDKVAGITIERTRRISLTFRQIVIPGGIPGKNLSAGELERSHVHEVYDSIAEHWHHTRGKRKVHWHSVREFLEQLPSGTLLADIGCGDGKYFGVNPDLIIIGCDRSFPLLQASHEEVISHQTDTFCCDAVTLPLMSDSFDAVMCIAVLHHISSVGKD
jgi:alkylated DNA repair protein alkB family protein 8